MPTDRQKQSAVQQFSYEQTLMPWDQVAAQWNLRSGENITRSRVWQIAQTAEKKLREGLSDVARLVGIIR